MVVCHIGTCVLILRIFCLTCIFTVLLENPNCMCICNVLLSFLLAVYINKIINYNIHLKWEWYLTFLLFYFYCSTTLSACGGKPADVVFVLDSSASISNANYQKMLTFTKEIVNNFDIGPDKTRIGLITFRLVPLRQIY